MNGCNQWKCLLAACGLLLAGLSAWALPPRIVHPNADWVALYNQAWHEAKVRTWRAPEGAPVTHYMDENVYPEWIWLWDSCFMAQFTKYAVADYPGIETLDALYVPLVEGKPSPLGVWHPDNPPLFAWCEWLHWRFHGDRKRLEEVLLKRRLLQRHYAWFQNPPTGTKPTSCGVAVHLARATAGNGAPGWRWSTVASGMDNTPRGRGCGGPRNILWVDAIAQQALSAKCIADLLTHLDQADEAAHWRAEYDALAKAINTYYWDECDGLYYDIAVADGAFCRVPTLASYWPLLAGVAPPERAQRAITHLQDPNAFGGERPFPTVARHDPDFDRATGNYWRGSIWLPTAYMTLKAMEQNGARDLADSLAARLLRQMSNTFKYVEPHTIWECYAPEADLPSTEHGHRVRPVFCGWSALGPINLFIEHILGLRDISAIDHTVRWEPPHDAAYPMGIENLTFGDTTLSLWTDQRTLRITTNQPLTLLYQKRSFTLSPGSHTLSL